MIKREFKVDLLKSNYIFVNDIDIYEGTKAITEIVSDSLINITENMLFPDGTSDIGNFFINQQIDEPNWRYYEASMEVSNTSEFTQVLNTSVIDSRRLYDYDGSFSVGDVVNTDQRKFAKVVNIDTTNKIVTLDSDIVVTDGLKQLSPDTSYSDWSGDTTYGLAGALTGTNNNTIYMDLGEEIIIDAGKGGVIYLSTLYTLGNTGDNTLYTSRFDVYVESTLNSGWVKVYESTEVLMENAIHEMSGEGRRIKIVSHDEYLGWCRIRLDLDTFGYGWDIKIKETPSSFYTHDSLLTINNLLQVPENIVDGVINYRRQSTDTSALVFDTYKGLSIRCDTWYEQQGTV